MNVAKHERNDLSAIVRSGLSQITWRKNVARQSSEDTAHVPLEPGDAFAEFSRSLIKAAPHGAAGPASAPGSALEGRPPHAGPHRESHRISAAHLQCADRHEQSRGFPAGANCPWATTAAVSHVRGRSAEGT